MKIMVVFNLVVSEFFQTPNHFSLYKSRNPDLDNPTYQNLWGGGYFC